MPSGVYQHSKEHILKLKKGSVLFHLNPINRAETNYKIGKALKGRKYGPLSEKRRQRISDGNKKRYTKYPHLKESIANALRGNKSPLWRGGISKQNILDRNSYKMRDWKRKVFERDDYRCLDCGTRSGEGEGVILNADHIFPFALFPRLRTMIENGRTLCDKCHQKTSTSTNRFGLEKLYNIQIIKGR